MMKANQFSKQDDAQVGIGTMIVFIATILVAAVAAGVLIDTSQKLQDKSTRTGNDAVTNVGTSFTVLNVWGDDAADSDSDFDDLFIDLQLSSGATAIDFEAVTISYTDGQVLKHYTTSALTATEADDTFWAAQVMRDNDGSFCDAAMACTAWGAVMNKDDVVRIGVGDYTAATPLNLGTSTDVTLTITSPSGTPISVSFSTPATITADSFVKLF